MQKSLEASGRRKWRALGAAVAGLAVSLAVFAPSADAAKVTGGKATVRVNGATVNNLGQAGVVVRSVKPGKKRRNNIVLPFKKGNFTVTTNDPAPYEPLAVENITGNGVVRGGLKFKRGKRSATVKGIRVNLKKRKVIAKVAGRKVTLFSINIGWATPEGTALRPRLTAAPLRLTKPAAKRLNSKLGTRAFSPSSGFGQLAVAPILAAS